MKKNVSASFIGVVKLNAKCVGRRSRDTYANKFESSHQIKSSRLDTMLRMFPPFLHDKWTMIFFIALLMGAIKYVWDNSSFVHQFPLHCKNILSNFQNYLFIHSYYKIHCLKENLEMIFILSCILNKFEVEELSQKYLSFSWVFWKNPINKMLRI